MRGEEEGQRMICWRQVHLHSLQTQHRPVLGVSIPAALTGRFMAVLCACVCVGEGGINWERHKVQEDECLCAEAKGGEQIAAMLHSTDITTPPPHTHTHTHTSTSQSLPYFMLPLSPLSFPSFLSSSPLCLIAPLFTWRSWPFHCSAGSRAVKPSQGEGCKSVPLSQEISWSSEDSTKPSWRGGPNASHTQTHTGTHTHTQSEINV